MFSAGTPQCNGQIGFAFSLITSEIVPKHLLYIRQEQFSLVLLKHIVIDWLIEAGLRPERRNEMRIGQVA